MPPKNQLSLTQLSVEQLDGLKKQFEADIQALTQAFDGLRGARSRFEGSAHQLESFKSLKDGEEMLVPLTSSLYVAGTIKSTKRVTVDVGTGYYIEQSIDRAQQFLSKRGDQMRGQVDKISGIIEDKQQQLTMVVDIMGRKMQIQRQIAEAEGQQ